MITNFSVLVIDDNEAIHEDFRKVLCGPRKDKALDSLEVELFGESVSQGPQLPCEVTIDSAFQGFDGVMQVKQNTVSNPYDLVFVDMRMPPGWDGLKTIKEIWAICPSQPIVLCTAYSDYTYEQIMEELGQKPNFLILKKPFEPEEILQIVNSIAASETDESRSKRVLAAELDGAVAASELSLLFQPIVNAKTSALRGFEALCRWNRNGVPVATPDVFIKVAEDTGQIHRLGLWVAEEAIAMAGRLNDGRTQEQPLKVTINASSIQLIPDFPEQLMYFAEQYSVQPQWIGIEITESAIMARIDAGREVLKQLKRLGFSVLIDDFGTGYSSLSALSHLPFDLIKLDRVFCAELLTDHHMRLIVKSVIEMAQALGKELIAEGIESEAQRHLLSTLGCDYIQGFLVSKPISAEEALRLAAIPDAFGDAMAA